MSEASQSNRPVKRGKGTTKSEEYLARLADSTFLDLWSYPNVFGSPGKELCDLLVVFGDDVLLFSDKCIEWPNGPLEVSWSRWYSRAIAKSVSQIRGADRWIRNNPDRIFLDAKCQEKLPLDLPPLERRRVHGICVALGAEQALRSHYKDDDGSFLISGFLKGDQHTDFSLDRHLPFTVGDVDPSGPFVHVFDQASLTVVLRELDTISDFTSYLDERAKLIRSGRFGLSPSEAELVANYLQTMGPDGHRFPQPSDVGAPDDVEISFIQGEYAAFARSAKYAAKKRDDADSYVWDRIITNFTKHTLAGTSVDILAEPPEVRLAERALRIMAAEPRVSRRALGYAVLDAVRTFRGRPESRFARIMRQENGPNTGVAYIFMLLKVEEAAGSYENYRRVRAQMLQTYCFSTLRQFPEVKMAVGIGMEPPGEGGRSEDLIAVELGDWDEAGLAELQDAAKLYGILKEETLKMPRHMHVDEFPKVPKYADYPGRNRSERRKAASERKKRR